MLGGGGLGGARRSLGSSVLVLVPVLAVGLGCLRGAALDDRDAGPSGIGSGLVPTLGQVFGTW